MSAKRIRDQGEFNGGNFGRSLGRASEVLVMKPTEVWECDYHTELGWLHGSRHRGLLVQRKVRSRGMVIDKVGIQETFEMAFI